MITPALTSTETFGLPVEASHLIAKLRMLSPEFLATLTKAEAK